MEKVEILVVGCNPEILAVILRLINANEQWNATGAASYAETIDFLQSGTYSLLLLGAGLAEDEETGLRDFASANFPDLKIVDHFGGGSGLLFAEIYQALT
ncbi:hypothetical protein [Pedobacter duraquae]|uniref:Response regulator receiver domain-containing protein n=1 Tax=Pedobacter duraquae TaxID=425511 RepID=A0A4R6IHR8_9SPHI|nr:hypothetical protein [Pedobacter duraquae]TDO21015.1 hypothetical protein CLV32_3653 [Pedobacter duraquae]